MAVGEKHHHHHHLMRFHFPHLSGHGKEAAASAAPKGCMAVRVGVEGEEEQQRFVVPLIYLNHPLFVRLLEQAEEEYGFEHQGAITIPCHVDYFRQVQDIIDHDKGRAAGGGGSHPPPHHNNHHHNHHYLPLAGCFRA